MLLFRIPILRQQTGILHTKLPRCSHELLSLALAFPPRSGCRATRGDMGNALFTTWSWACLLVYGKPKWLGKIFGGKEVMEGQGPWQASLRDSQRGITMWVSRDNPVLMVTW